MIRPAVVVAVLVLAGCGRPAVRVAATPEAQAGPALRELRELGAGLTVRPEDCTLWDRIEALAGRTGDPRVHLVLETEAAERPRDPAAAYLLGFLYARQHRFAAARERFEAARAESGDAACVLDQLAALADLEEKLDEALTLSRSATVRDPGRARSWLMRGTAEFRSGRTADARASIERSVGLQPSPEGYGNLAAVLQALGDGAAAATVCEDAARRFPDHPSALFNLAVLRGQQNRLDEAEALYVRLLGVTPGHLTARYNLGLLLAMRRRYPEAEAAFRAVLGQEPGHTQAQVNLGSVLVEQGRVPEGETAYRDALARDPGNAEAYFNLAVLAHRRGAWAEAVELSRACLARDPANLRARSLLDDAGAKLRTPAPKG